MSHACSMESGVSSRSKQSGPLWSRREVTLLLLGVVLGQCLHHKLLRSPHPKNHVTCSLPNAEESNSNPRHSVDTNIMYEVSDEKLLFVGVMTSRRYLRTRARAIYDTWGSTLNGSLVFFVGSGETVHGDLPVEILHNVLDSEYPPRRKSFAMLDFIYRKYGRHYAWFLRADDDLFVDLNRLETLLHSLNDSDGWYLGHPGTGRPEEEGRLGLPPGSAYCMGGPGVLLSRGVLGALSGRLGECGKFAASDHEDSELGRCVYNATGLSCVNNPHVYRVFKQNYDDTSGIWLQRTLRSSRPYLTFHPVKDPRYLYFASGILAARIVSGLQVKVKRLISAVQCIDIHVFRKCQDRLSDELDDSSCEYDTEQDILQPLSYPTVLHPSGQDAFLLIFPKNAIMPDTKEDSVMLDTEKDSIWDCDFFSTTRSRFASRKFPHDAWSLLTRNVLYTLTTGVLPKPVDYGGVSIGLNNALQQLSQHLRTKPRASTRGNLWSDTYYRRLLPGAGVQHVIFVHIASSLSQPYVVTQECDELRVLN